MTDTAVTYDAVLVGQVVPLIVANPTRVYGAADTERWSWRCLRCGRRSRNSEPSKRQAQLVGRRHTCK